MLRRTVQEGMALTVDQLNREVTRLSNLVAKQAEEIRELKKHSHPPVDFTPMLNRIAAIEEKLGMNDARPN